MNILAIGAHPDDLEVLCGGTLAKYAGRGDRVTMAVLTNGNMGDPRMTPVENAHVREEEQRQSAAVIGAQVEWVDVPDEFLTTDLETRMKVVDVVRRARPDVILTHSPLDYHPDHRNAGQLAFDASMLAWVGNIKTAEPNIEKLPVIYYFDTIGGVCFVPTECVDITETLEVKQQMLACHKSQIALFHDLVNKDLPDIITTVAKFRGYQAGVGYAEGFQKVEAWYRGTAQRLLP